MASILHDAALRYVQELGWYIFPIRPRDKRPLTAHGFEDASNDPAQVSLWWNQTPHANIGIDCGRSNLAVLDLDGAEGIQTWNDEIQNSIPAFQTPIQYTGNGAHALFKQPEPPIRNTTGKIAKNIDTRGDGGYILAAPSIHPNGTPYRWSEYDPFKIHLAEFPDLLLDLLNVAPTVPDIPPPAPNPNANVDRILQRSYERVASAQDGFRNDTLNKAAFYLGSFVIAGRISEGEVRQTLLYAAARAGLTERESLATITSGLRGAAKAGV